MDWNPFSGGIFVSAYSEQLTIICTSSGFSINISVTVLPALMTHASYTFGYWISLKKVAHCIRDMYHAHVDSESDVSDVRIRSEFAKHDSIIRLLFSTIKMGMGVDTPDIDLVVIYGVATCVTDLWQGIGLCLWTRSKRLGSNLYYWQSLLLLYR